MNYSKFRKDLIHYYGTAMFSSLPMAVVKLGDVEVASDNELIKLAKNAGFDFNDYE